MEKLHTLELTPQMLAASARLAHLPHDEIDFSDIQFKFDRANAWRGKFVPLDQTTGDAVTDVDVEQVQTQSGRGY